MDRTELMRLADEYALSALANPLSAETTQARRNLREAIDAAIPAVRNSITTEGATDKDSLTVAGADARCPGQDWPPFGIAPQCLGCARQQAEDDASCEWIEPPTGEPCPQLIQVGAALPA